jgi:predicted SprT family Zn-dependent metalloprotease
MDLRGNKMAKSADSLGSGNVKETTALFPNGLAPGGRLMPMNKIDVTEYIAIACVLCGVEELIGRIRVAWNGRFIARMGDARWDHRKGTGLIRLSMPLWPKASQDEQVETITHEACHVIADYKFGGRQMHGARWQEMMRLCGYEKPRRCHKVNLDEIRTRRLRRRISTACGCPGGNWVTPLMARRVQAGAAYMCRACGQRLRLHQPIASSTRGEKGD